MPENLSGAGSLQPPRSGLPPVFYFGHFADIFFTDKKGFWEIVTKYLFTYFVCAGYFQGILNIPVEEAVKNPL
jgi:hypothetical protein